MSYRAVDAVLPFRTKAVYLEETFSKARPSVEAELRGIDSEEWSDVSASFLNERSLLG